MYVYIKQPGIVCLLCWLCLSCTLQRTEHPALRQAGYLMEEHADSAFSLLKSISSLTGMSPEDKAGYALLLAEAADKNGYSPSNPQLSSSASFLRLNVLSSLN